CCTDGCQTKTGEKYEAVFVDKLIKAWKLDNRLRQYILDDPRYISLRRRLFHLLKYQMMPKMLD
ncbi:hypothetical protein BgiMline_019068, partial [Biomphalaria glabrata]